MDWTNPDEAAAADLSEIDKELGRVGARLTKLALEKQTLIYRIFEIEDENWREALAGQVKDLERLERSWQRIQSGHQSRLRGPNL